MQKSDYNQQAVSAHRRVRSSTTLNRKYVKKPVRQTSDVAIKIKRSPSLSKFSPQSMQSVHMVQQRKQKVEEPMAAPVSHPMQALAIEKMKQAQAASLAKASAPQKMSAKELKEQAIQKALASASKAPEQTTNNKKKVKSKKTKSKMYFGFGRVLLAFACAATAVFAIVYFVNLNMPDISMRVAAMQSGFDAKYPSYVPRDYSLSGISSESEKITLNFRNSTNEDTITLTEEQSPWDSNALLSNYVKDTYGENYTTIREQGLTIYISGSNACWVNGGVAYKLAATSLSKKQIKTIATSL